MPDTARLEAFLDAYDPAVASVARAAIARLAARWPGAVQLVYDNHNALAVAFAGGPKQSQIVCSIALYPRWASLFFTHGTELADPEGLLTGSGAKMRHVRLATATDLDHPAILDLLDQARAHAHERGIDLAAGGGGVHVKLALPTARPRRPRDGQR